MGCEGTRRRKGGRGNIRPKSVWAVSGISKRRDDWGAGGDPIGATLAPRLPRVFSPFAGACGRPPKLPKHRTGLKIKSRCRSGFPVRARHRKCFFSGGFFGFLFRGFPFFLSFQLCAWVRGKVNFLQSFQADMGIDFC